MKFRLKKVNYFVGAVLLMSLPKAVMASEQLAVNYGCVACHAESYTRIGPSFEDIAKRYVACGKPMVVHLAKQIAVGSKGAWGDMPMAGQFLPTEEERLQLSAWILDKNKLNDE